MEIKYTNFDLDPKVYGKNEITVLIDPNDDFIYNTIYDVKKYQPKSHMSVSMFLSLGVNSKKKKLIFDMLNELEIEKDLQKRTLKTLSSSELTKVLIVKMSVSTAKTIILESLDAYLNYKDLQKVLKTIKAHLSEIDKNFIITANRIETLIQYVDRYIEVRDDKIIYNGDDFTKIKAHTDIREFTELANKKEAKLKDYKEPNDLLKAIYRSIEK